MQESIRPSDRWIIDLGIRSEINVNPNLDPLKAYDYETGLEARNDYVRGKYNLVFYDTKSNKPVLNLPIILKDKNENETGSSGHHH
ncbi:MAG: hypothetical protein ACOYU0_03415 [Nitrospirota bacterium]